VKYQRQLFLLLFFSLVVTAPITRGIGVSDSLPSIDSSAPRRLQVAVFDRPPYTYKDKSGAWTGLSIDLWGQISGRLGLDYDYVEVPLADVYEKLHAGSCDLALAIALSGEKAEQVEFTEPYLFSHGAVVTLHKSFFNTLETLHSYIWNKEVFLILFLMIAGMILFSLILLVAERKHQLGHFSGNTIKGFGSALWFSAVTMTTVGYGDKTPLSAIGRMITFFWMLVGVLLIALFTGTVASSITTAKIQSGLVRFDDLARFRVGCLQGSRMDLLLQNRGIPAVRYTTPEAGLDGFAFKTINAYAGDSLSLEYLMSHNFPGKFRISIIPDSAIIFAFAARPHLPELRHINSSLLQITLAPDWHSKLERWTGPLTL